MVEIMTRAIIVMIIGINCISMELPEEGIILSSSSYKLLFKVAVLALPRKTASSHPLQTSIVAMAKAMKDMQVMKKKAAMKAGRE